MSLETYRKGIYRVLRITYDIDVDSDISELRSLVGHYLTEGNRYFAIHFTPRSFLYTRSIAIVITCSEMIKDKRGCLAIIKPNNDIRDLLNLIDIDNSIVTFEDESQLETVYH